MGRVLLVVGFMLLLTGCGSMGTMLGGAAASIAGQALYDAADTASDIVTKDIARTDRWLVGHEGLVRRRLERCERVADEVKGTVEQVNAASELCIEMSLSNQPTLALGRVADRIRKVRSPPE